MRTSKPISSISYNTKEHLQSVFDELLRNHVISDYMYIFHYAEEDEAKDHWHIWCEPNKMLDTMALQDKFKEMDLKNPTAKPLGCINFQSSKTDDWILYAMHFEPYLMSKGQTRKYHYLKSDFFYADEMTFEEHFNHAMYGSEWACNNQRIEWLKSGNIKPLDLIMSGAVPVAMASAMASLDRLMTDRNGRETHTPLQPSWKPEDEKAEAIYTCRYCGKQGTAKDFVSYGGTYSPGIGVCRSKECIEKQYKALQNANALEKEEGTVFDGFVPTDDVEF